MSEFMLYLQIGLKHVLDINAYDHILFLTALVVPYHFKDWKKILILVTTFTLGHTLALILSVFGWVKIDVALVEFLIPITILCTAVYNLFNAGKGSGKSNISVAVFITLFFGIIHGLGFSNYFNSILSGKPTDKVIPLLEFATGIEAAQIIVVLTVLIFSWLLQTFFRFSKRDFVLILSAFVVGVVTPMIIESKIWSY